MPISSHGLKTSVINMTQVILLLTTKALLDLQESRESRATKLTTAHRLTGTYSNSKLEASNTSHTQEKRSPRKLRRHRTRENPVLWPKLTISVHIH